MRFLGGRTSLLIKILVLVFLLPSCILTNQEEDYTNHILWYDQPAKEWEEALPLGNGRLGVMVFGKTSSERIQLNDDSLWPGDHNWNEPGGNKEDLKRIRTQCGDKWMAKQKRKGETIEKIINY